MYRITWLIALLFMAVASCQQRPDAYHARIQGHIEDGQGKWIFLEELLIRERIPKDSTLLGKDGKFQFLIDTESPGFYLIRVGSGFPISLVISPGDDVTLKSNPDMDPNYMEISGSGINEVMLEYLKRRKLAEAQVDSLTLMFRETSGSVDFLERKQELDSTYASLFHSHKTWLTERIIENDTSILGLFLINQRLGRDLIFPEAASLPLFQHLDSSLYQRYPNNIHATDHHDRVKVLQRKAYDRQLALERLQPGKPAPDFILPDSSMKQIALQHYLGRNVLLYFWAGECGPCRMLNRELPAILRPYPQLQLITIAMDIHVQLWKGALRLDALPGVHLSDLQGPGSPLQTLYINDRNLPLFFLIDKEGRLLESVEDPSRLKETLERHLR